MHPLLHREVFSFSFDTLATQIRWRLPNCDCHRFVVRHIWRRSRVKWPRWHHWRWSWVYWSSQQQTVHFTMAELSDGDLLRQLRTENQEHAGLIKQLQLQLQQVQTSSLNQFERFSADRCERLQVANHALWRCRWTGCLWQEMVGIESRLECRDQEFNVQVCPPRYANHRNPRNLVCGQSRRELGEGEQRRSEQWETAEKGR